MTLSSNASVMLPPSPRENVSVLPWKAPAPRGGPSTIAGSSLSPAPPPVPMTWLTTRSANGSARASATAPTRAAAHTTSRRMVPPPHGPGRVSSDAPRPRGYSHLTVLCLPLNSQLVSGPEKSAAPHCPAGASVNVAASGSAAGVVGNAPFLPVTLNFTRPGVLAVVFTETLVMPASPALLAYVHDVADLFAFQPTLVTGSTAPGGIATSATVPLPSVTTTRAPFATGSIAGLVGTVISPLSARPSSPAGVSSFFSWSFGFATTAPPVHPSSALQVPSPSVSRQIAAICDTATSRTSVSSRAVSWNSSVENEHPAARCVISPPGATAITVLPESSDPPVIRMLPSLSMACA